MVSRATVSMLDPDRGLDILWRRRRQRAKGVLSAC